MTTLENTTAAQRVREHARPVGMREDEIVVTGKKTDGGGGVGGRQGGARQERV